MLLLSPPVLKLSCDSVTVCWQKLAVDYMLSVSWAGGVMHECMQDHDSSKMLGIGSEYMQ